MKVTWLSDGNILRGYYSKIRVNEAGRRLGFAHEHHLNARSVMDLTKSGVVKWSKSDRENVKKAIKKASRLIKLYQQKKQSGLELLPKQWILLQTRLGMDWNLPYTTQGAIVLNQKQLYSKHLVKVLIHEAIHLAQRANPSKFEQLYKQWGFQKMPIKFNQKHRVRWITNPDAPKKNWVVQMDKEIYLPLMIADMDGDFLQVLVKCKRHKSGKCLVASNEFIRQSRMPAYGQQFNVGSTQIDHPNEISAHHFANLIHPKH